MQVVVPRSELEALLGPVQGNLDQIGFYRKIRQVVGEQNGMFPSEVSSAVERFERFLCGFGASKQALRDTGSHAFVNLYGGYLAATLVGNGVDDQVPRLRFSQRDNDAAMINGFVKAYVQSASRTRSIPEFVQKTDAFFAAVHASTREAIETEFADEMSAFEHSVQLCDMKFERFASAPMQDMQMPDRRVFFNDVGGLVEAISKLQDFVLAKKHPDHVRRKAYRFPKGFLFHGPPGTGKTLLVNAFANELGIPYKHVYVSDVLSKWFGESEQNLRRELEFPGLIFLDEFDSLARRKQESSQNAYLNTVNTLALCIENNESTIYCAATNDIENIDPKLKRPGRFDEVIYVGYPNMDAIRKILDIHIMGYDGEFDMFATTDRDTVADAMYALSQEQNGIGITGSDIKEVTRRAHSRYFFSTLKGMRRDEETISTDDFLEEISRYEVAARS